MISLKSNTMFNMGISAMTSFNSMPGTNPIKAGSKIIMSRGLIRFWPSLNERAKRETESIKALINKASGMVKAKRNINVDGENVNSSPV